MCGIAGILNYHSVPIEFELEKMVASLTHRGPDGWGVYLSHRMAMGHTRLSIVDLEGGHQPMMSDRFVISYNGEIYNHIEIRQQLIDQGVTLSTTSDTEVALKAYEVFGIDAFRMFNGQFAMLIWDRKAHVLLVARDRYGVRPLYILQHGNGYYFSSEIKAFDQIEGYQREFDVEKLYEHGLLWNTIGDDTIYQNIRSLCSGTVELFEKGKQPKIIRYYEIGESQGNSPVDYQAAQDEFVELLNDSVRLRLRSDVPVGAYLSGGIDSSVVTYLISNHNKETFKTFSVSFEDPEFDESFYQQEMSSSLNTNHYALKVDNSQIDDHFFDAVYHFERPVFRTAGVPLFLLSKAVRENNIKVVLTGEGADEILFGYDSYKELKMLEFWRKFPESKFRPLLIKKLYPHLMHYSNPKQFGFLKMYYKGFLHDQAHELSGLNIRIHNNTILSNYFNKDHSLSVNKQTLVDKITQTLPDNFYSWTILQQNQFLEMKTLLSGYLLSSQGDRMSLAHGVEGRYPFLDHRVVEALFYYSDNYKLSGFSQKYILGKAFADILPETIVNRPKKPYTAPDLKAFFNGGTLSETTSFFLSKKTIEDYGIFDKDCVNRFVGKFSDKTPNEIGYRDNMLVTFILSCQMTKYWAMNPKSNILKGDKMTVKIIDY